MKLWEKFSDNELAQFVQESTNINELAVKLGYSPRSGSGNLAVKEMLKIKNFDSTHFLGQNWRKDNYDYTRFQSNSKIHSSNALAALIHLRGRKCENCGLEQWQGQDIPLQVHHIDGNHYNNVLDNLQILCPNCHAQTDTYAGKNKNRISVSDKEFVDALQESNSIYDAIKKLGISSGKYAYERANKLINEYNISLLDNRILNYCKKCGVEISKEAEYCSKCMHENQRKAEWPSREILKEKIYTTSFEAIGREYGVDGNSIRNWCDYYNLPRRKKDIRQYSRDEWALI